MGKVSESLTGFSSLKRRLVIGALTVILVGFAWKGGRWLEGSYTGGPPMQVEAESTSSWMEGSRAKVGALHKADRWGDGAVKFGVSFLAAMVVGGLLRAFFKTMITVIAVAVGTLFFLHHKGMIDPFWENFLLSPEQMKGWAASESVSLWEKFKAVVPSTGAAMIGFGFGLKR